MVQVVLVEWVDVPISTSRTAMDMYQSYHPLTCTHCLYRNDRYKPAITHGRLDVTEMPTVNKTGFKNLNFTEMCVLVGTLTLRLFDNVLSGWLLAVSVGIRVEDCQSCLSTRILGTPPPYPTALGLWFRFKSLESCRAPRVSRNPLWCCILRICGTVPNFHCKQRRT